MPFDQPTRNRLARFVGEARALLSDEFTRQLQHEYGLDPPSGNTADLGTLTHLDDARRETARILRETLAHYLAGAARPTAEARQDALDRIVREQAYTVLNRLCALRMAEARGLLIESVARGYQSRGFQLYARLTGSALGETGDAYRSYLFSLFDEFAVDLAVLFDRFSPEGRLFPREATLLRLLEEINHPDLEPLWAEDETIGWIYQYFNSDDERRQMRAESSAPRNSRELAVRNQFFTPRYVVEFLTDNTLGRIWYEMTQGQTKLVESCRYLVRRPNEIWLAEDEPVPETDVSQEDLTQEELLQQPVYIPYRPLKDPRKISMLDPACGSMHFGLYAFDLYERIYEEAWDMQADGRWLESDDYRPLAADYAFKEAFLQDVPRLIIDHNIHGIDIDPRAVQIAGLSLWLRAQKSWQGQGLSRQDRPHIRRSNVVCAEPMPGEQDLLEEFAAGLQPRVLGQLVRVVFEKMKLAGEAGSLLQIEEELRDAVDTARKAYDDHLIQQKKEEGYLPGLAPERDTTLFDYFDLPDPETFWDRAEALVLVALENYAARAQDGSGYSRQLFAEDAARGFSFIDLCRKRYDVVLMNPPFGLATGAAFEWLRHRSPETFVELYASFVRRANIFAADGFVGAITSRGFFSMTRLTEWRKKDFISRVSLIFDLGLEVMDNAFVRSCAYVLSEYGAGIPILILDANSGQDRNSLAHATHWTSPESVKGNILFIRPRQHFLSIPEAKVVYKAGREIVSLFQNSPAFEGVGGEVRTGLTTFDDNRFLRLLWEVQPSLVGKDKRWQFFSKGGDYAKYYTDVHLLINRMEDGKELAAVNQNRNGQVAQSRQGSVYYYRPGLTFTSRSGLGISVRALPAGCVISHNAPTIYPLREASSSYLLGWVNSRLIRTLIEMQASADYYTPGSIKILPWVQPKLSTQQKIEDMTVDLVHMYSRNSLSDETSANFTTVASQYLCKSREQSSEEYACLRGSIEEMQSAISNLVDGVYNLASEMLTAELLEINPDADVPLEANTKPQVARDLLSYGLGCIWGRWDVRTSIETRDAVRLPDPFGQLSICPPGMLKDSQGLPATASDVPIDYPLSLAWLGIVVDDPSHFEDIEGRVREVLFAIWSEQGNLIEQKTCEILDMPSLRAYFSDPKCFFDDHLKRYSRSRRYAPIYWPLSAPSGSYTLWLYYHRLSDQILYTCVNDFVDPKLEQVSREADQLRQRLGRSSEQERELERLSELALELQDFRAELLRIAAFWRPNLNDGVQITAAPLWRLFQHRGWQQRLQDTWEKMEAGEYDWAHLAMSVWPARVVPKCVDDRSLAIAHDLEDLFWVEDIDGWRNLRQPEEEIAEQKGRQRSATHERLRGLLSELTAGPAQGVPALQVCQHLAEGDWDDFEVAARLWPERVAEKCWGNRMLAQKLGVRLPKRRSKAGHTRVAQQLVEAGCSELADALVTALRDAEASFDLVWSELEQGLRDEEPLALALWPERVVDRCVTDVELAARHGLRRFFWIQHPGDAWRRRRDPRQEVRDEVARRQRATAKGD